MTKFLIYISDSFIVLNTCCYQSNKLWCCMSQNVLICTNRHSV